MPDTGNLSVVDELHELAAPIRARLEKVEQDLIAAEDVVRDLKESRQYLRTALRHVDPSFAPESKPGPKGKRAAGGGNYKIGAAKIERIRELLEENRAEFSNGNGFTGTDLARRPGWPVSQSGTSQALKVLHERGVVRLDRRQGIGGAKYYVLV